MHYLYHHGLFFPNQRQKIVFSGSTYAGVTCQLKSLR